MGFSKVYISAEMDGCCKSLLREIYEWDKKLARDGEWRWRSTDSMETSQTYFHNVGQEEGPKSMKVTINAMIITYNPITSKKPDKLLTWVPFSFQKAAQNDSRRNSEWESFLAR